MRLIDTKGNISMSIIATVTDALEVYTDSNYVWYLCDMLLGFNEMMLDRGTHTHTTCICVLADHHEPDRQ